MLGRAFASAQSPLSQHGQRAEVVFASQAEPTYTRCLPDIDGKVGLGLGHVDIPRAAAIAVVGHVAASSRVSVVLRLNGPAKAVEDTSCAFASQLEGKEQTK